YANYNTKTFIKWWEHKLTGFPKRNFTNKSMSVGTILEDEILDLYEQVYGVYGERNYQSIKGMARANTDYLLGDKVSDVKATTKSFEWFLSGRVPINYKRQLIHYCYVIGLNKASIIAYQVNDDTLNIPFTELDHRKLYEIPVKITDKDIQKHKTKLDFLEHYRDLNIFPKV